MKEETITSYEYKDTLIIFKEMTISKTAKLLRGFRKAVDDLSR